MLYFVKNCEWLLILFQNSSYPCGLKRFNLVNMMFPLSRETRKCKPKLAQPEPATCQPGAGLGNPKLAPPRRALCRPKAGPTATRRLLSRACCRPPPGPHASQMLGRATQRPGGLMVSEASLYTPRWLGWPQLHSTGVRPVARTMELRRSQTTKLPLTTAEREAQQHTQPLLPSQTKATLRGRLACQPKPTNAETL
jgi:hypothetical protein